MLVAAIKVYGTVSNAHEAERISRIPEALSQTPTQFTWQFYFLRATLLECVELSSLVEPDGKSGLRRGKIPTSSEIKDARRFPISGL